MSFMVLIRLKSFSRNWLLKDLFIYFCFAFVFIFRKVRKSCPSLVLLVDIHVLKVNMLNTPSVLFVCLKIFFSFFTYSFRFVDLNRRRLVRQRIIGGEVRWQLKGRHRSGGRGRRRGLGFSGHSDVS